jgi:hypothetical protein
MLQMGHRLFSGNIVFLGQVSLVLHVFFTSSVMAMKPDSVKVLGNLLVSAVNPSCHCSWPGL